MKFLKVPLPCTFINYEYNNDTDDLQPLNLLYGVELQKFLAHYFNNSMRENYFIFIET